MAEEALKDIKNIKSQETYTLPSKGLLYTKEDNIPASITLRRMTTKEDKLRLRNQSEFTIRRDILQACIMNEGVDAGKLKLMDANFLLFRLRSISLLNDLYRVSCRCPYCGAEFIHELNLSEVPINYMNNEKMKLLKVELPISKIKVDLKLPSLNESIKAGEDYNEYVKAFPNADHADYLYNSTNGMYIKTVNGQHLMKEEIPQWLDNLDILDNRVLTDNILELQNTYGFDENIVAVCPSCKEEVTHGLPITTELFTPSKEIPRVN